ncbi:hypothetical protein ACJX0J_010233, partial [Zea mays]
AIWLANIGMLFSPGLYAAYDPVNARTQLDLPLNIGATDAFEEYIRFAHNPRFQRATCLEKRIIGMRLIDVLKTLLEDFRTAISFLNSSNQRIAQWNSTYFFCVKKNLLTSDHWYIAEHTSYRAYEIQVSKILGEDTIVSKFGFVRLQRPQPATIGPGND